MNPTENPWPLIILLFVVAVGLGIAWSRRQQPQFLIGIGLCLLLSIGVWVLDRSVVTTREALADNVVQMTKAFQERDLDRTISYVSPHARALRMLIGTAYNILEIRDDMRVTDIQVEMKGQETRAVTRFRVNATFIPHIPGYPEAQNRVATRWEAKWQLEGDQWRMIDIIELNPITGEREDRIDVVRFMVDKIYPDH